MTPVPASEALKNRFQFQMSLDDERARNKPDAGSPSDPGADVALDKAEKS